MPAPKVTYDLIRKYIQEGRGFGRGENYKAFIQIKRWNSSPVSTQTIGRIPPFKRPMHFLSRSEWLIGLLLGWAGCNVREQYPLWPWRSHHPLFGESRDLDPVLPMLRGTLEHCADAGIRHGSFVGTKIPYIWTLDLLVDLPWRPRCAHGAAMISVKPLNGEAYRGDPDPLARGLEKLEIERRIAKELGFKYFIVDRTLFPGPLLGQLEWLSSAAHLEAPHPAAIARDRILSRLGEALQTCPPIEWKDRLCQDYRLDDAAALTAVQSILWHQLLDLDITREIRMTRVIPRGGHILKRKVREMLQGGIT